MILLRPVVLIWMSRSGCPGRAEPLPGQETGYFFLAAFFLVAFFAFAFFAFFAFLAIVSSQGFMD